LFTGLSKTASMSENAGSDQAPAEERPGDDQAPSRRSFLTVLSSVAMALGLTSAYGTFAALAVRFLYPAKAAEQQWLFVTDVASMNLGDSLSYRAPSGQMVSIARLAESGSAEDFIALSGVCPHLGCQVHWESQNDRFFCPCHNGAFDPAGNPTEGPPKDAGQSLSRYPLSVRNGLLFIEVPNSTFG
jgi:cytochrome b6-f complex iron-sulfur subunit